MTGKEKAQFTVAMGFALFGLALVMDAGILIPIVVVVGGVMAFASFAKLNHEEMIESIQERRAVRSMAGDSIRDSVDADEVIPPSRRRRQSKDNRVVDIYPDALGAGTDTGTRDTGTRDMEYERQIMMAQAKEAKLEAKLAQARSARKLMEERVKRYN